MSPRPCWPKRPLPCEGPRACGGPRTGSASLPVPAGRAWSWATRPAPAMGRYQVSPSRQPPAHCPGARRPYGTGPPDRPHTAGPGRAPRPVRSQLEETVAALTGVRGPRRSAFRHPDGSRTRRLFHSAHCVRAFDARPASPRLPAAQPYCGFPAPAAARTPPAWATKLSAGALGRSRATASPRDRPSPGSVSAPVRPASPRPSGRRTSLTSPTAGSVVSTSPDVGAVPGGSPHRKHGHHTDWSGGAALPEENS